MDALLILVLKNKEFGTLVIIACFTIAQFFQNRGQFSLHLEKINNIKETSDEAKKESREALEIVRKVEVSTSKITGTIEDIRKDYKEFYEGKWEKIKNAKEKESCV